MAMSPDRSATYEMLGRRVRVEYDSRTARGADILREELSRYPRAGDGVPDLTVRYRPVDVPGGGLVNPRNHVELKDGFVMRHRMATVRVRMDGPRLAAIDFHPTSANSALVTHVRRMLDMQFSSREERAGVMFHEMVLVPAAYWMSDLAIVHASAFSDSDGRVTLVGGTGGVGKTSLALELCMHHGFRFLADDIAFVDDGGHVWPNLAYPKIYAYNLEDNPSLAERLLAGRGAVDRLHWALHRRRGPQYVRRRIAPDVLYGSYDRDGGPLHRYVVLAREDRSDVSVTDLDASQAASMSTALMQAEYYPFHNHLHWHAFNRSVMGRTASLTLRRTVDRWEALLRGVLADARCNLVRIPLTMPHDRFKREMADLLARKD
ncbi:MAG: hypothetical protein WD021_09295 [Rhodothermales bacterium]